MNNLLKQNKIIVVIILAALFQLISFIFSQIVVNLDEELEKTNYKTISNEIKLDDLDIIIRHTLPDLLVLTTNQGLNLKFYRKYYSDTEYNKSLTKTVVGGVFPSKTLKMDNTRHPAGHAKILRKRIRAS